MSELSVGRGVADAERHGVLVSNTASVEMRGCSVKQVRRCVVVDGATACLCNRTVDAKMSGVLVRGTGAKLKAEDFKTPCCGAAGVCVLEKYDRHAC